MGTDHGQAVSGSGRSLRRWRAVVLLAAGLAIGVAMTATPVSGHIGSSVTHLWNAHIKPKTDARYYTKAQANARYLPRAGTAADAELVDGLDSTELIQGNGMAVGRHRRHRRQRVRGDHLRPGRADPDVPVRRRGWHSRARKRERRQHELRDRDRRQLVLSRDRRRKRDRAGSSRRRFDPHSGPLTVSRCGDSRCRGRAPRDGLSYPGSGGGNAVDESSGACLNDSKTGVRSRGADADLARFRNT